MSKKILALALLAFSACSSEPEDRLVHLGTFEWDTPSFTGLSGLEITDDGDGFLAVSDRGWFLSGRFQREEDRISGVLLDRLLPILGQDNLPVSARRLGDWSDAEGLALAPDGTYWISFERWARVARYTAPDQPAQWIRDHPSFYKQRHNRQLEALALHPDGTLFTLPEQPFKKGFPLYRLDGETWSIAGHLPKRNGFAIVGADFDATGQLYLLERKLFLGLWWQNRIRRIDPQDLSRDEILWTGRLGEYNNLEGISIWYDESGLRMTLVSDNNGNKKELTQFVEYRLEQSSEVPPVVAVAGQ